MKTNKTNMFCFVENLTDVILSKAKNLKFSCAKDSSLHFIPFRMTVFRGFLQSNMFLLNLSLLLFTVSGCTLPQEPVDIVVTPKIQPPRQDESVAKRFSEPTSQKPTVVESAMELSKKYADLSKEAAELKQQNKELSAENQRSAERLISLEAELKQTQKELTEANDLLVEMRVELNNWKTNVLGFRQEMRAADTEQLKALFKILTVLGGEVKDSTNNSSNKSQDIKSLNDRKESSKEQKSPGETYG